MFGTTQIEPRYVLRRGIRPGEAGDDGRGGGDGVC